MEKINLAILISGRGSNMAALIKACSDPEFPARVRVVISNRPDAAGLAKAEEAGIETKLVNHKDYKDKDAFETALQESLSGYDLDLICLAGFMRIFTPSFVKQWAGKIINTHPSLLPLYGGAGMYGKHVHEAVFASGDKETGVSVHIVTAECDQGPIILQRKIQVDPQDSAASLAQKVLEQEHIAYPEAVRLIGEGRVRVVDGVPKIL